MVGRKMICIRGMHGADIPSVMQVRQELAFGEREYRITEQEIADMHKHFIVAVEEEKVVGYCGWVCGVDEAELLTIAVHPVLQKRGIGTKLLSALIAYASKNYISAVLLEVRLSNYHAQSLYMRLGFERVGIRHDYYTDPIEDAVVMRRVEK